MKTCPHFHQSMMAEEMAPSNHQWEAYWDWWRMRSWELLRSYTTDDMKLHQAFCPAGAMMSSWQNFMKSWASVWQEPVSLMLQEQPGPYPRGRRCSHGHILFWAWSPLPETSRKEGAKWPREDSMMRCSWSRCRCSRSRAQQHQSRSPGHQLPSEAPSQASPWRPYGMAHLPWANHAHSTQMSEYTTL